MEYYQQQPSEYYLPQATAPPLQLPSEKADLLDKINPNKVVINVFHKLLGEEEVNGNWIKNPLLQQKALSLRGAWDIATLMTPVSSQNVALGKLNNNEIRLRALSIAKTAQMMCLRNWKEYNITGTDQLKFVHELVFSNTFITLKQSENEGIRRLIGGIGSGEIGQPISYEEQVRGGVMDSIFRRK